MASVSVYLLIPVKAHSLNNGNTTWVVYFDASIEYFGTKHCPYAILAIICFSITHIPIVLLLVYQFNWFKKLLSCLHIRHPLLQEVMESFKVVTQMALNQEPKIIDGFQLCHLLPAILYC